MGWPKPFEDRRQSIVIKDMCDSDSRKVAVLAQGLHSQSSRIEFIDVRGTTCHVSLSKDNTV